MWRLTISQKRAFETTGGVYTENIEFIGEDIEELVLLVVKMSKREGNIETAYRIERVGVVN